MRSTFASRQQSWIPVQFVLDHWEYNDHEGIDRVSSLNRNQHDARLIPPGSAVKGRMLGLRMGDKSIREG